MAEEGVDELAIRAQEAFTAQQDKKVMKKLKLSSDCIPIDKVGDFLRCDHSGTYCNKILNDAAWVPNNRMFTIW